MFLQPRLLQVERLKLHRSFLPRMVLVLPLIGVLYFCIIWFMGTVQHQWALLPGSAFNGWVFLVLPIGVALLCGLSVLLEARAGQGGLQYRPIPQGQLLVARFLVLGGLVWLSNLVFVGLVVLLGLVSAQGEVPLGRLLGLAVLPALTSLPVLALNLWVARRFGLIGSLLFGGLGAFTAMLAETSLWWCSPWAWAMRANIPLVGARTNGLFLSADSPLWHWSPVVPVLLGVLCSAGVLLWMGRRPVEA